MSERCAGCFSIQKSWYNWFLSSALIKSTLLMTRIVTWMVTDFCTVCSLKNIILCNFFFSLWICFFFVEEKWILRPEAKKGENDMLNYLLRKKSKSMYFIYQCLLLVLFWYGNIYYKVRDFILLDLGFIFFLENLRHITKSSRQL